MKKIYECFLRISPLTKYLGYIITILSLGFRTQLGELFAMLRGSYVFATLYILFILLPSFLCAFLGTYITLLDVQITLKAARRAKQSEVNEND